MVSNKKQLGYVLAAIAAIGANAKEELYKLSWVGWIRIGMAWERSGDQVASMEAESEAAVTKAQKKFDKAFAAFKKARKVKQASSNSEKEQKEADKVYYEFFVAVNAARGKLRKDKAALAELYCPNIHRFRI